MFVVLFCLSDDECISTLCPVGAYCAPVSVSNMSCVCLFVGQWNVTLHVVAGNSLRVDCVEVLLDRTCSTVRDTVWTLSDDQVVSGLFGFGEAEVARGRALYGSGMRPIQCHGIQ